MVLLTTFAREQLDALTRHYDRLDRDIATVRVSEAVLDAIALIDAQVGPFLPAPRPYPDLKRLRWLWLKSGPYWVAFSDREGDYAIMAVFHERANIPGRLIEMRRSLP